MYRCRTKRRITSFPGPRINLKNQIEDSRFKIQDTRIPTHPWLTMPLFDVVTWQHGKIMANMASMA